MIFIALGANLPSPVHGPPCQTLEAAIRVLEARGLRIAARSRWYETAPVPVSDQPWYVNGVVAVETTLAPPDLLAGLHEVEAAFGRVRGDLNAARILDLDIVDYDGRVEEGPPILPHPRLQARAFVLMPLADIDPGWRHPVSGRGVGALLAELPAGQDIRVLDA